MNLIRATPQVMGTRFDGVYNDKGILRFENHEAFMVTATKLDELVTLFDQMDKSDSDSVWYREFPILDKFEHNLGFYSIRRHGENLEKRYENAQGFGREETILSPESDPFFRTFYNKSNKIIVGDSLYHYASSDYMLEYPIAKKNYDFNAIRHSLTDLGSVNLMHFDNETLQSLVSKDKTSKLDVNNCKIIMYSKDYEIVMRNVIFQGTNSVTNYSSYTFVLELKEYNGVNYGVINEFDWKVWNSQRTTRLAAGSSSGTDFTYNFIPSNGLYYTAIKLTNALGAYNDFIKTEKWCYLPVRLASHENNILNTDCCLFRDKTSTTRSYNNGNSKIKCEFGFYNTPMYFSIYSMITNYNSSGKKRKADELFVNVGGVWKNITCENPNDFAKSNYNFRKKRCIVRKLNYLKRITYNEATSLGNATKGASTQSIALSLSKNCK
jgi:hypothetical protein